MTLTLEENSRNSRAMIFEIAKGVMRGVKYPPSEQVVRMKICTLDASNGGWIQISPDFMRDCEGRRRARGGWLRVDLFDSRQCLLNKTVWEAREYDSLLADVRADPKRFLKDGMNVGELLEKADRTREIMEGMTKEDVVDAFRKATSHLVFDPSASMPEHLNCDPASQPSVESSSWEFSPEGGKPVIESIDEIAVRIAPQIVVVQADHGDHPEYPHVMCYALAEQRDQAEALKAWEDVQWEKEHCDCGMYESGSSYHMEMCTVTKKLQGR